MLFRSLYLAFAAALVPGQLLAAVLAELRDSHDRLAHHSHALRRSNEALEQFVRIASHDLREPLNTVVQFGSLIRNDHQDRLPPEGRHYLELVCSAAGRMRTLLDDVTWRLGPGDRIGVVGVNDHSYVVTAPTVTGVTALEAIVPISMIGPELCCHRTTMTSPGCSEIGRAHV